jgi:hypothetical protein
LSQQLFGLKESLSKSWNGKISLRVVIEGHVIEDVGRIMTAGVPDAADLVPGFSRLDFTFMRLSFALCFRWETHSWSRQAGGEGAIKE